MTGLLLLDGAVLAISFFNTILLFWLGLMVLLNAERRTWGIWVAASGLLAAAAFLVIHSALFAGGWVRASRGLSLGWLAGWALVVALPFSWYLVMLWYAGYWDDAQSPLHQRHRLWLRLTALATLGLLLLLLFANPFPSYSRIVDYETAAIPRLDDIPPLGLAYPLYILLCISLSMDVLLRPAPSGRMMGDLARRRARPWLIATSLALLAVSGLVALVVAWLMLESRQSLAADPYARLATPVAWLDLIIGSLLAVAVLLLGQAVVSYEIFTGRTLPRRGLRRHWHSAILLAAGFGLLAAASLTHQVRPVNGLLLGGALVALFFALLGRQSFAERERYIEHLRPFVASLGLYEHLLTQPAAAPPDVDVVGPLRALCEDVLGARVAHLAALGPQAPLVGPVTSYPDKPGAPLPALASLSAHLDSPETLCAPLDPAAYGGATWAVPLGSHRGLIGVLLLGEKRDGGLYTQEEIEIARASGERLIDTQASAQMAQRLMALQRRRLVESQVLDRQARRVLHDDVLPRLHTVILNLSQAQPGDALALLAEVHREVSALLREMPAGAGPELARWGLIGALRRMVDDELQGAFDALAWQVEPEAEARAAGIPERIAEVLFYAAREALRNAARHGRGGDAGRRLHLRFAAAWRDMLEICIEDNGVGLAGAPSRPEGGGQGLALHSTMMAVIGGSLLVESLPGTYTRVSLLLPSLPAAGYARESKRPP